MKTDSHATPASDAGVNDVEQQKLGALGYKQDSIAP